MLLFLFLMPMFVPCSVATSLITTRMLPQRNPYRRLQRIGNETECEAAREQAQEEEGEFGSVTCQCANEIPDQWAIYCAFHCVFCHSSWGCYNYTYEHTSASDLSWSCYEFSSGDTVCELQELDDEYAYNKAVTINGEYCSSVNLDPNCNVFPSHIYDCTNLGEGFHVECNGGQGNGTSPFWDFIFDDSEEFCVTGECIETPPDILFPLKPLSSTGTSNSSQTPMTSSPFPTSSPSLNTTSLTPVSAPIPTPSPSLNLTSQTPVSSAQIPTSSPSSNMTSQTPMPSSTNSTSSFEPTSAPSQEKGDMATVAPAQPPSLPNIDRADMSKAKPWFGFDWLVGLSVLVIYLA